MAVNSNLIPEDLNLLDLLNIFSIGIQMDNMVADEKQTKWINLVIKALVNDVIKLHEENKIIIEQNEEILELLKGGGSRTLCN